MRDLNERPTFDLVFKISKYCNLRCSYCYEFKELGVKDVMTLDHIERMLRNLPGREFFGTTTREDFRFIWHGGEPLLIKPSYYKSIGLLQQEIIRDRSRYSNGAQSNLTVLTDEQLDFIASGAFFDTIGVSLDVYGEDRIDLMGRNSTSKTLKNMQRLRNRDVSFGAITVLTRSSLRYLKNTIRFFEALDIDFRVLPYHLEAFEEQTAAHGMTLAEITQAMCAVFDVWIRSDAELTIQPLAGYVPAAIRYICGEKDYTYNKRAEENIFIIGTDGSVYGADVYTDDYRYGNLVEQPLEEIMQSKNRLLKVAQAERALETFCFKCKYYGACSGSWVADATPIIAQSMAAEGCHIAHILDHIVDRFEEGGVDKIVLDRASSGIKAERQYAG